MEWRSIPQFPKYEVSETGRVRNAASGDLLTGYRDQDGYLFFGLYGERGRKTVRACRAVLSAFVGPPPTNKHQAAHGDNDRANDSVGNLRWATCKENQHDRIEHGTAPRQGKHPRAKLTAQSVAMLRTEQRPLSMERRLALAAAHGVSLGTINAVIYEKRNWADV